MRSLRHGKRVLPLLARRGTDIPLHLEARQYLDFGDEAEYAGQVAKLLVEIESGEGVTLLARYRETYVTAPQLPVHFVARPEALAALRNTLLAEDGGRHIALTALRGMGGLGKTVFAQALECRRPSPTG